MRVRDAASLPLPAPLQVSAERALVSEQLELLQRENDLLVAQQRELGREAGRLQQQLDAKSRGLLAAANDGVGAQVGAAALDPSAL